MLSRLKSTVTQALPGNPITRDYEVNAHRASAGPGLFWKVYDGITKSSKQVGKIILTTDLWKPIKKCRSDHSKRTDVLRMFTRHSHSRSLNY